MATQNTYILRDFAEHANKYFPEVYALISDPSSYTFKTRRLTIS
jgi:hypothetical protein